MKADPRTGLRLIALAALAMACGPNPPPSPTPVGPRTLWLYSPKDGTLVLTDVKPEKGF